MIGFLFFLALQPISRKTECHVNLRYVQVVYLFETLKVLVMFINVTVSDQQTHQKF